MSAAFVPLLPPSNCSAGSPSSSFQSLRPPAVADASDSESGANDGAIPLSTATWSAPRQEPAIHCEREGDRITRIRVTCACGDIIELDCAYASPTPEARDQRAPDGV